ncbi:transketolase family protein [Demetria terragena]|uniref:transketolase family protein n=1 Tax=Demetria terragena TaxID=63959 RepID=UPI000377DB7D|nr:transketolase C-terminal domain-containing protein [Demetria terragena]
MTVIAHPDPTAALDLRGQFVLTTQALLQEDSRLALVMADISVSQFERAIDQHPGRVVNVGIREQLLVSATAGLALAGLRPIAHTFGAFLIERAWEQVKLDLSHQDVGAILVGSYGSYDWPAGGRTHQSPGDVALLDTLRDWTIHTPGHPAELDAQLRAAAARDDRTYIRVGGEANPEPHVSADGRWSVLRRGARGTVVAVGPMLRATEEAVRDLDVTLLYASTVRPFDAATLRATLDGPRVVFVEPYLSGTSSRFVAEALGDLDHRQLGLGVGDPDPHRYGEPEDHDRLHGLDAHGIRTSVSDFMR